MLDHLPTDHRVGLFAQARTYPAWIRFASASSETDRDRDVRGMSISLSGVAGENLTPGETRQDFVLNSHPVMVAANTKDFLELLKALDAGGLQAAFYFLSHPRSARDRIRGAPEPDESPGHPLLEHHALSVRRRSRRQVHRPAVVAAQERANPIG